MIGVTQSGRFESDADLGWSCQTKTDSIREFQRRLGQEPCFRTEKSESCLGNCEWHFDCCRPIAEWLRGR